MRSNYFSRLLIVILIFIIVLASIVFFGLMLMVSYGGGAAEMGPLGQVAQWGGQLASDVLAYAWELLNQLFNIFEGLIP